MVRHGQGETVLLVCSGSAAAFNLEDFYGAGHLVSHFTRSPGDWELSDAALAALLLHDGSDALSCLSRGRVGRMMLERGLRREVEYAARQDRLAVVPELRERAAGGRHLAPRPGHAPAWRPARPGWRRRGLTGAA